jgi:hypothetical protein
MEQDALGRFGQLVMQRIRDRAIADGDNLVNGRGATPEAQEWHSRLERLGPDGLPAVLALIPKIVDQAVHHLLWTLDQESELRLLVSAQEHDSVDVREASPEGLIYEVYGPEGWRARFCTERFEMYD